MTEKKKLVELTGIAHGTEKSAWAFCLRAKIDSVRNLVLYLRKLGLVDGHMWTYGELANEYDISRPRCVQICQRTERWLRAYFDSEEHQDVKGLSR